MNAVQVELDLRTRFGRIQAKLGVPDKPMRLAELAWNVMSFDERLIAMAVKTDLADGTKKISCTKGCGACCRQLVPLSPPEAWMIADVVRSMPPQRRDQVLDRFAAVHTALNASALANVELRDAESDVMNEASVQYFELGVACPFLEDEACSIHPQRPSVCREFLVTSPAADCAQLRTKKTRRIPTAMRMSEALARLTAKVLERDTMEIVPLHMALHFAEEHAADDKRTWPAPLLMQKFFEEAQAVQLGS